MPGHVKRPLALHDAIWFGFFTIPKQYFCTTMLFKMLIHDTIVCIIIRFLCQVKNRLIQVRLSLNLLEAIKIRTAYITRKHLRITDESTMFNNYREIIPGDFESPRFSCSFKIFVSFFSKNSPIIIGGDAATRGF